MEPIKLSVENRSETGKAAAARLRRAGKIPANVYTSGRPAKKLVLSERDYQNIVRKASSTQFFDFQSEDSDLNGVLALVRDVQSEPTKALVQHIDFLEVEAGHKLRMSVPVKLVGEAPCVKLGVGIISQSMNEVDIECLPKNIPASFELDITGLNEPGQSLNAGQITLPEGVELRTDVNVNIVTVVAKQELSLSDSEAGEADAAAEPAQASAPTKKEGNS